MAYAGPHTLGNRTLSEFLATFIANFLLLSMFANLLLPSTKGHGMGFPFIAIGVGLAYFIPVLMFNSISSYCNPAMALAAAIVDQISFTDFIALASAQFAGAFVGAVAMWVHYLPNFKTVPEPPDKGEDYLLRRRDVLQQGAL